MPISASKISRLFAAALMFSVVTAAPANDFDWIGQGGNDYYENVLNWYTDGSGTAIPSHVSDNATFSSAQASIRLIDEEIGDFLIQQVHEAGGMALTGIDDSSDVRELTVDKLTVLGNAGSGLFTVVHLTNYARIRVR